jgi:mannose-6-phosphate isomerase
MPAPLACLKLEPILRPMPWGEERWLASDLPGAESQVAGGPFAGRSLRALMLTRPAELMGPVLPAEGGRFPLLWKFIQARERLSLQVHPDAEAARRLGGGARPKTEAWCVLGADPDAELVLGLRAGVGRAELAAALHAAGAGDARALEALLQRLPARAGDFVYLPAGLLHALGGGILLAELQQASDTTYRAHDWGRLGPSGQPRALHRAEALAAVRPELHGPVPFEAPRSGRPGLGCPFFELERLTLAPGQELVLEAGLPRLLTCLTGAFELDGPSLGPGQTALVPAAAAARLGASESSVGLLATARPPEEGQEEGASR